jgi:bacterioferritin-associated ferredoxin
MVVRIVRVCNQDLIMYICNCMGVTEREIRGAADLGCGSLAELSQDLGVGTCCGKCLPDASRLLRNCGAACPANLRAVGGDD